MSDSFRPSSLGIVSLLIALFGAVFLAGLVVAASIITTSAPAQGEGASSGVSLVGVELLFLVALQLVAAGMGIASLRRPGERRLFGLLGTGTATIVIALAVGLALAGHLL
ncbi:hypothetical protein ACM26W_03800 [Halomonas sp. HK25]|uniref:hypothetical protein n=1 Tax=Halomonas sp. HK25 TaxID=3394321 RepID=UPI0039FD1E66